METRQSKSQRLLVGVVLVLTLLGLTVIALDWKEIRQVVVAANWRTLWQRRRKPLNCSMPWKPS